MDRKSLPQRLTMPLPELEAYYRQRRRERWENNEPFGGVKIRRILHPVLLAGIKLKHVLGKQKVTVLADRRLRTDRPVIYASTHIGWDDVEMLLSAIGDHAYLFWGDPGNSYQTIDGFLLDVNGCVICDTDNKADRHVGKETCVAWLQQGGNLLIFPEGAWNVTDNLPIMPLYTGAAEMAIRTGAEIVPVAIQRYGRDYTVNIGRNISPDGLAPEEKQQLTRQLRDAAATLRWEIWEGQPMGSRADIPADHGKRFLREILDQIKDDAYSLEAIQTTRFHTREEAEQRAVERHLDSLRPSRENAFLLRRGN